MKYHIRMSQSRTGTVTIEATTTQDAYLIADGISDDRVEWGIFERVVDVIATFDPGKGPQRKARC